MSVNRTTRRGFLKFSAAAAAAGIFAPNILRSAEDGGQKKLNFAGIGVGGKGESDIANIAKEANIVALCDVDRTRLAAAGKKYKDAKMFESFREMFDAMGDKIDGVTVSTPDHCHFPAAMEAIKRGKHVCVQKPLVNRIWEANQLLQAARKKGVKTNMGNQGHTGESIRQLKEWIGAGIVGNVKEIHVWTNRPVWPQGFAGKAKLVSAPIPASLNWSAWLAQCPEVPFLSGLHPFAWRGHLEYGAGAMGDMGCHLLDGPYFACDLGDPYKVEAQCDELTDITWPKSSTVECFFKTPRFGKVKLTWYEGGRKPERPAGMADSENWSKMIGGFMIIGDGGTLLNAGDYCDHPHLLPKESHDAFLKDRQPAKTLERSLAPGDPQKELIRSILQDKICGSNFEYAVPLTRLCLLGNAAIANPGKTLHWDTKSQGFDGCGMNSFIKRAAVREGWDYSADNI